MKLYIYAILITVAITYFPKDLTAQDTTQYNLPPKYCIPNKMDVNSYDFSEKMNEIEYKSMSDSEMNNNAKFIKEGLTDEDWDRLKKYNPEEYKYYREALTFYEELSPKVKTILTTKELWDIYMFKSDLKEKLLQY